MSNVQLRIGDRAPDFTLLAAHAGDIEETSLLKLLVGQRGVVLTTYVLDFTGGWRNQVSQFRDAYGEFRRQGVEVATISVDSPYSHQAWAKELDVQYPMISDFSREFMDQYGVPERNVGLLERVSQRSAFVVDAEGIIRYVWYPPEGRGSPPLDEILEAARNLPGTPRESEGR